MSLRQGRRATTGFLRDFRDFALKGNVVELAIAVIIGGAFGKIITALVEQVIMPIVTLPLAQAGTDWRASVIPLGVTPSGQAIGIGWGSFLGAVVDFIIIAFILFLGIRAIEGFKRQEAAAELPPDPALQSQQRLTDAVERLTQVIESRSL